MGSNMRKNIEFGPVEEEKSVFRERTLCVKRRKIC